MGHASGQAPHGLHLLKLPELLLEPLALADVRAHSREPDDLPLAIPERNAAELVGNRRAVLANEPRLPLAVPAVGGHPNDGRHRGPIVFLEHLRHRSAAQLVRLVVGDVLEPAVPALQHAAVVERVEDVRDALHDVLPIRQRAGHGLVRALELPRRLLQVRPLARFALSPLRLGEPPALVKRIDEGGGQGQSPSKNDGHNSDAVPAPSRGGVVGEELASGCSRGGHDVTTAYFGPRCDVTRTQANRQSGSTQPSGSTTAAMRNQASGVRYQPLIRPARSGFVDTLLAKATRIPASSRL